MGEPGIIERLAADTKIGYSLDRRFYCDDEVFAADMERVIGRKWLVAGHVDRVRNKGDYFLFKIGAESIIIVRSDESTINAFYNVCRHRGSLICTKPQGRVARLTCGYHAWSYGLDGALLAARLMPADFSKKDNGLHRCHLRVFHGFIFINLSDQAPEDFDATFGDLCALPGFSRLRRRKNRARGIVSDDRQLEADRGELRRVLSLCAGTSGVLLHASAGGAHRLRRGTEFRSRRRGGEISARVKAWEARAARLGRPIGTVDDGPESSHLRLLLQRTIREGYETETPDGRPAAPLMGKRLGWDQGRMYLSFSPFTQLVATNDFAVLFLFSPRSTMHTDVDLYWLVDGKASEVDVKRMIWGWDETTKQDKEITENNQAGILSKRYQPGRYSEHERRVVTFQQWYLAQFGYVLR